MAGEGVCWNVLLEEVLMYLTLEVKADRPSIQIGPSLLMATWDEQSAFRHYTPSDFFFWTIWFRVSYGLCPGLRAKAEIIVFVIVDSIATFCDWNEVLFNNHPNSWKYIHWTAVAGHLMMNMKTHLLWRNIKYHTSWPGKCLSRWSSAPLKDLNSWSLDQHYAKIFPDYMQAFVLSSLLWSRLKRLIPICCMKYMLTENVYRNLSSKPSFNVVPRCPAGGHKTLASQTYLRGMKSLILRSPRTMNKRRTVIPPLQHSNTTQSWDDLSRPQFAFPT